MKMDCELINDLSQTRQLDFRNFVRKRNLLNVQKQPKRFFGERK